MKKTLLLLLLTLGFGQLNLGNNAIKIAADSTVIMSAGLTVNGTIQSTGGTGYHGEMQLHTFGLMPDGHSLPGHPGVLWVVVD